MSKRLSFREGLILDARCMLNLYASGHIETILESIPVPVAITETVQREALCIFSGPKDNVMRMTEDIDVQLLLAGRLLLLISPNEDMQAEAANLAHESLIDDGEAITVISAVHYKWSLGTDYLQSIETLVRKVALMHTVSTLDIINHWISVTHPPLEIIKTALWNIEARAGYKVHCIPSLYS